MTRPIAVLRPEPGNAATAARVEAAGMIAIRLPLFVVRACDWTVPDPTGFDALLLTSANAVRLAERAALAKLGGLPVLAVGGATARAAREAGLSVRMTGTADAEALLAEAAAIGFRRALHLAGRERTARSAIIARTVTVYAGDPVLLASTAIEALTGTVVLLHSPRAAARLAELADDASARRDEIRLAALSDTVARAAGDGWDRIAIAAAPDDDALVGLARTLAG